MGCGSSVQPRRSIEDASSSSSLVSVNDDASDGTPTSSGSMALPDVMVFEEEDQNEAVDREHVPDYWVNKRVGDDTSGFDDMFYVPMEQHDVFNEILKTTYQARVTRDRPCPTVEHSGVKGGCPCVRPGGDPGLPVSYHVRRVLRVEDSSMWSRYIQKREAIRAARKDEKFKLFNPPIMSDEVTGGNPNLFAPLEKKLNEVYLFHGTRVRYALSIAQEDFNIDLAGSSTGTMYGLGAYLAESVTKADEYAKGDEPGGFYEGMFAILICRVCMGKLYYTRQRNTEAGGKIADGSHDSTCGDRAHPPINTFRELVVYDADQLYPEYIVLYQRAHQADDLEELQRLCSEPYHMELPLHWANCHKDPRYFNEDGDEVENSSGFDAQYIVRTAATELLQHLVDTALQGESIFFVHEARRVEIASAWVRYINCKTALWDWMGEGEEGFPPIMDQLEDPINLVELCRDMPEDDAGRRAIASQMVEGMEERINEHYLWCPVSKEGAQWLSRGVEKGDQVGLSVNNLRFFSNLQVLIQSKEDDNSTRYVLLCRVACGHSVASEDDVQLEEGQDCVVTANYVRVARAEQVYVEYILELGSEPDADADADADVFLATGSLDSDADLDSSLESDASSGS